jgi:poly(3-hydroxybutyrate) depolymerase
MRAPSPARRSTGQAIKQAAPHAGPWPTVAIWHGTADMVVSPDNAGAILRQWQEIRGLDPRPSEEREVDGHPYRAWRDDTGAVVLEEYRVVGMGHGTPLATGGECGCGQAGAFMLEAGISATVHSAKTWGLLGRRVTAAPAVTSEAATSGASPAEPAKVPAPDRITRVIEDALRSAGLMK